MPYGAEYFSGTLKRVMMPCGVILPMQKRLSQLANVNQRLPSGPALM